MMESELKRLHFYLSLHIFYSITMMFFTTIQYYIRKSVWYMGGVFNETLKMSKNNKWACFNRNRNSFFIIYSIFKFDS